MIILPDEIIYDYTDLKTIKKHGLKILYRLETIRHSYILAVKEVKKEKLYAIYTGGNNCFYKPATTIHYNIALHELLSRAKYDLEFDLFKIKKEEIDL